MLSVFQLSQYFLTKEGDFDLEGGGMCGGRVGANVAGVSTF